MPAQEPRIGHIEGVPLRSLFENRQRLRDALLHRPLQAGIDYSPEGACSIVVSGGYVDDEDHGTEIVYTGQGGNDPATKRQIKDQEWTRGNLGLQNSCASGLPVRVIPGKKGDRRYSPREGYRYDGLFTVRETWEERGRDGFRICRFHLVEALELVPEVDRTARPWAADESDAPVRSVSPAAAVATARASAAPSTPPVDPPGPMQDWVAEVMFSSSFSERRQSAGTHVPAARLQSLLSYLDANGGRLSHAQLAEVLGLPARRIAGFVATVSRVVNIDGFESLVDEGSAVRLDAALLRQQFGTQ